METFNSWLKKPVKTNIKFKKIIIKKKEKNSITSLPHQCLIYSLDHVLFFTLIHFLFFFWDNNSTLIMIRHHSGKGGNPASLGMQMEFILKYGAYSIGMGEGAVKSKSFYLYEVKLLMWAWFVGFQLRVGTSQEQRN